MATGGAKATKESFSLPSHVKLTVSKGDMLQTAAVALTTGEDAGMAGHGAVTKLLLKACPDAYKTGRDKLKRIKDKQHGEVYSCSSGKNGLQSARGSKISFDTVYHAIVPQAKQVGMSSRAWEDKMKQLYTTLFEMADTDGKISLALPLLGSGGAGANFDEAVKPLAHSLVNFHHKSKAMLKEIIVYVQKDEAFSKLNLAVKRELQAHPKTGKSSRPSSVSSLSGNTKRESRSSASSATDEEEMSNLSVILGKTSVTSAKKSVTSAGQHKRLSPTAAKRASVQSVNGGDSNLATILQSGKKSAAWGGKLGEGAGETKGDDEDADKETDETPEEDVIKESSGGNETPGAGGGEDESDHTCPICLDKLENPKKLDKCGHVFCTDCIEDSFRHHKPVCPTCMTVYGIIIGNQPAGTMSVFRQRRPCLPGYENCGIIGIDYYFSSGIQGKEHPNPGQPYHGTRRRAFLPDCPEGRDVCRLLRVAFENRLTFTVGRSRTTGADNVVTWNDIHHKTNIEGGPTGFGYPDPNYLSRVKEELAARGVTEECLQDDRWRRKFDV